MLNATGSPVTGIQLGDSVVGATGDRRAKISRNT